MKTSTTSPGEAASVIAVIERMTRAQNAHDADAFAACFADDYRSEQPAHPKRAFRGAQRVRENWVEVFANIPDLRADTLRTTVERDTAWLEVHWSGHRRDGSSFELSGMILFGVCAGKIAWGRLYLEPVEKSGETAMDAVMRATRSAQTP